MGTFWSADGVSFRAATAGLATPVPWEPSLWELVSRRRSPESVLEVVA